MSPEELAVVKTQLRRIQQALTERISEARRLETRYHGFERELQDRIGARHAEITLSFEKFERFAAAARRVASLRDALRSMPQRLTAYRQAIEGSLRNFELGEFELPDSAAYEVRLQEIKSIASCLDRINAIEKEQSVSDVARAIENWTTAMATEMQTFEQNAHQVNATIDVFRDRFRRLLARTQQFKMAIQEQAERIKSASEEQIDAVIEETANLFEHINAGVDEVTGKFAELEEQIVDTFSRLTDARENVADGMEAASNGVQLVASALTNMNDVMEEIF